PICWPWFVNSAPTNTLFFGLLRSEVWRVVESKESELLIDVVDSETTRAVWPHAFRASLHVRLDEKLSLRFTVENRGSDIMTCRDGLHSFFKVGESLKCVVKGVAGLHYYYGAEPQFGYSRILDGDFAVCRMKRGYVFAGGNRECKLVDPVLNRTITVGYVKPSAEDSIIEKPDDTNDFVVGKTYIFNIQNYENYSETDVVVWYVNGEYAKGGAGQFVFEFAPEEAGSYEITVKINGQELNNTVNLEIVSQPEDNNMLYAYVSVGVVGGILLVAGIVVVIYFAKRKSHKVA
ncbi:MAG: hypothetical protein II867_03000, partial [Clostridia bacterium]|nr:hypothetical protein [Clostridia bacterium]